MSLGFLTESALLPSKAKAIKVDSKSLVDLRAVVFQKEQERQERKRKLLDAVTRGRDDDNDDEDGSGQTDAAAPSGARGFGRFAHLKATKKRSGRSDSHALSRDEEKIGKASNRGVEKRRRQDDAARALEVHDDDDKAWHDKSRAMLAKKAKLYDALVSGRALEADSATAAAVTECLVNFRAKQQQPPPTGVCDSTSVEVTDEFGRTRVVATDSAAYAGYLERQAAAAERPATATHATASSPSSRAADVRTARDDSSTITSSISSNSSSFVTSQWEKRLNAQEKTYLQQVHASVGHAKAALPTDSKTRKQRRLAMLRQQQQQQSNNSSALLDAAVTAPLPTQDEQVATAQATAFLHDLL